jgi:hypothetical protein
MNRRGFFGAIAGIVAGATLDPERLLWRPGAKLISIPAPTNQLLTVELLSRECLAALKQSLVFARQVNAEYQAEYGRKLLVGDHWKIGRAPRFYVKGRPA